jgi:hypothetical protein
VGLGPWWTMATNGSRTSPALSAWLPRAIGAHRGRGKRERTQWGFSPKSKSAGVMMDRGWQRWGVQLIAVTPGKWRSEAKGSSRCGGVEWMEENGSLAVVNHEDFSYEVIKKGREVLRCRLMRGTEEAWAALRFNFILALEVDGRRHTEWRQAGEQWLGWFQGGRWSPGGPSLGQEDWSQRPTGPA